MRALSWVQRWNWRLAAAALSAVAILHILATFAAPELATASAYDRIAVSLPLNTMQILPPVTPAAQVLPFLAPDARYALCRFDTTNGSVALKATLPGPGWTLALYSATGENFYTGIAPPGRRLDVSLKLIPSDDRFAGLTPEARGQTKKQDVTLSVAAQTGLAVVRAPDQGAAYAARNLAELRRATCAFRAQ